MAFIAFRERSDEDLEEYYRRKYVETSRKYVASFSQVKQKDAFQQGSNVLFLAENRCTCSYMYLPQPFTYFRLLLCIT